MLCSSGSAVTRDAPPGPPSRACVMDEERNGSGNNMYFHLNAKATLFVFPMTAFSVFVGKAFYKN